MGFFLTSALPKKSYLIPSLCIRKDKYDRSINKYHVEVDEDDDECSEDLEKELHESSKDQFSHPVSLCLLPCEVGGGTCTQETIPGFKVQGKNVSFLVLVCVAFSGRTRPRR